MTTMTTRKVQYPTPGEILLEEFLKPMAITQYRLAKAAMAETLAKIKRWGGASAPEGTQRRS